MSFAVATVILLGIGIATGFGGGLAGHAAYAYAWVHLCVAALTHTRGRNAPVAVYWNGALHGAFILGWLVVSANWGTGFLEVLPVVGLGLVTLAIGFYVPRAIGEADVTPLEDPSRDRMLPSGTPPRRTLPENDV